MPRNAGWLKLYERMIDSPQILELNDTEFRLLVSVWCLASSQEPRGSLPFSCRAIHRRVHLSASEDEICRYMAHFVELGLLETAENGYVVVRWEEHQYQYESWKPSARREQKRQEREKGTPPVPATDTTNDLSQACRKTDKDKDKELDSDKETDTDTTADLVARVERKKPNASNELEQWFVNCFWPCYPRKENKQQAWKALQKLNPDGSTRDAMIAGLNRDRASPQWHRDGGAYIPHPGTWINNARWQDQGLDSAALVAQTPPPAGDAIADRYQQNLERLQHKRQHQAGGMP